MPDFYDPTDWYWRAEDGRIFGSLRSAFVAEGDEAYARWRERGNAPTAWPADGTGAQTDAALDAVTAPHAFVALEALRAARLAAADAEAEHQRLRWITPGAGQAMTYQRKVEEAYRLEADAEPDAGSYPMLAASLGIDGDSLAAVGAVILQQDAAWTGIGAAIEARRLGLKRDIAAAGDRDALAAIDITAGWPDGAGVP